MAGSAVSYMHEDRLGSVRMKVSGSKQVSFNYVPFGVKHGSSGPEVFAYTGMPYDSVTGLYYFSARYCDPAIGRFVPPEMKPRWLLRAMATHAGYHVE